MALKAQVTAMNLGRETETLEFKKSTGELKKAVISIMYGDFEQASERQVVF